MSEMYTMQCLPIHEPFISNFPLLHPVVSHTWEAKKRAIFLYIPSFSGGENAPIVFVEREPLDLQSPSPRMRVPTLIIYLPTHLNSWEEWRQKLRKDYEWILKVAGGCRRGYVHLKHGCFKFDCTGFAVWLTCSNCSFFMTEMEFTLIKPFVVDTQ